MKIIQLFSDKTKRVKREDLISLEEYCAGLFHSPKHEMLLLLADDGKTLLHLADGSLKKCVILLDQMEHVEAIIDGFLSDSVDNPRVVDLWKQSAMGGVFH